MLVAVLFGLGHLPATSAITPLTPTLVVRALVLNGIAGITFAYLYWKHSLEAAMIGHMSAHVMMQIPGVIIVTRRCEGSSVHMLRRTVLNGTKMAPCRCGF